MNILRGMFRLSIIAAILAALYASYGVLQRRNIALAAYHEMKFGYECGARISDEQLSTALNGYRTINIGKLGCSSRDFYVSMDEINAVRAGQYEARFGAFQQPAFDLEIAGAAAVATFIAINLFGFFILAAMATFRWIARGFKPTA